MIVVRWVGIMMIMGKVFWIDLERMVVMENVIWILEGRIVILLIRGIDLL